MIDIDTENVIRDGGIVVVAFVLASNFVLNVLDKLGKLPEKSSSAAEHMNGVCLYPGEHAYKSTVEEVRQIHQDGIRRAQRDEYQLEVLQKLAENIQAHTQILRNIEYSYKQLVERAIR